MAGDADIPQQLSELVRENERLREALRFYADERNWLNERELRGFPGSHGNAIASRALNQPGSDEHGRRNEADTTAEHGKRRDG